MDNKIDIKSLNLEELTGFIVKNGEKAFRTTPQGSHPLGLIVHIIQLFSHYSCSAPFLCI